MMEHVHQHEDDEVHRGVVVIVKQHLVERGLLELPLGVGFYRFVTLWGVCRHSADRFYHMGSGEWGVGSGKKRQGDKEKRRQGIWNFLPLVPMSPCLPFSHSPLPTPRHELAMIASFG